MNSKKHILAATLLVFFLAPAWAEEGHDHEHEHAETAQETGHHGEEKRATVKRATASPARSPPATPVWATR